MDAQTEATTQETARSVAPGKPKGSKEQQPLRAPRRAAITIERAIGDYLLDHEGGNRSPKTLEWHRTALRFLREFLAQQRHITLVSEVEASDLTAWFVHLRKTPGVHGKLRSERTVQTYARSARAFFHWLVRQAIITKNPFDRVVFPKVGKPLIKTITPEEFEQLLRACSAPNETGLMATRAAVRNRAILWVLYDSGIRVSELCGLRVGDFERKQGVLTVKKKRAGITGKWISPHIFRHTFALRYLVLGNDPFSLQELLGHEDMSTVKNYMHMNDETIQEQKRKYSPGDHLPTRMPGLREVRRQQGKRRGRGRKREL